MLLIFRVGVLLLFGVSGYFLGSRYGYENYGVIISVLLGVITIYSDQILKKVNVGTIVGGIIGIAAGILFAELFLVPIRLMVRGEVVVVSVALTAIFGYGGLVIGLNRGRGMTMPEIFRLLRGQGYEENLKILDTSVIIDGRISDVCEAGFL